MSFTILFMSLCIGSFLNVIIYRLPQMMEIEPNVTFKKYNLLFPQSHCLHCKTSLRIIDNIPIVSYCLLLGKCRFCRAVISFQYPLVELLTLILSFVVLKHFQGLNLQTVTALLLTWGLIALSVIDFKHYLLPDLITLPFLWLGLLLGVLHMFQTPESCILGAVTGYLSLWIIYQIFKYLTGKEGMGYGDFKLLSMLGAWLGVQAVPLIILIASLLGSIIGLFLILFHKKHKDSSMPFGPYLAIGGFVSLLWQKQLIHFYHHFLL